MKKPKKAIVSSLFLILALALSILALKHHHIQTPNLTNNLTSRGQPIDSSQPVTDTSLDKSKRSLTDPASIWVVVNKQRPLNPLTYAPSDLTSVGNGQQLRKEAASALTQLLAGAKIDKLTISPLSGYRSYNAQVTVYKREVAANGQVKADTESAKPGYSEHQTGLAIDVGGGGCGIEDCFGNTKEGKWLVTHAYLYGFIIRYVPGKESITGYRSEPWHIRYVGAELATELHNKNIQTLEEFFGL